VGVNELERWGVGGPLKKPPLHWGGVVVRGREVLGGGLVRLFFQGLGGGDWQMMRRAVYGYETAGHGK